MNLVETCVMYRAKRFPRVGRRVGKCVFMHAYIIKALTHDIPWGWGIFALSRPVLSPRAGEREGESVIVCVRQVSRHVFIINALGYGINTTHTGGDR